MSERKGFQLAGGAAVAYEQVLVPLWFERWAHALLDLVALAPGEKVLDVACGTGVTTRLAKRAVGAQGKVVGLDINAPMLAIARDLAPDLDIAWIEADACDTGLETGSCDAVISQHGYHYLPDKPAALAEMRRALAPGGRIALSIWEGHSPYTAALCEAVARFISADAARTQRSQRETPGPDDLAQALTRAGFRDVEIVRQTLDIRVPSAREFVPLHLGAMPIAGAFQALPEGERDRLVSAVEAAMAPYVRGNGLVYPDAVNVMTARR
ncbi:MAG: methyltransferase domain-containing protein [Alphaproteobacteria bacterium]|nr:methyltransferase domain-containing protein [Alphaproteobacteria bacterium]MDX5369692.1 methyltransferase domain-containing protein [Alphaproteobacteria bacterium]MDX5464327.1 methyltransferase domain-containing protein [Alphaproteobacteria bacterium]